MAACLVVGSTAANGAASQIVEHGDFEITSVHRGVPGWWWVVPLVAVLTLTLPALFWKRRRGYVALLCLVLAVLVAFAWKRSYRGEELLSVASWRKGVDGAVYADDRSVESSAGGVAVRYEVIWLRPRRGALTYPATVAEVADGPNPRVVFARGSLVVYPAFKPEGSFGLFPYQGLTNPGVKTLAFEAWSERPPTGHGSKPVASYGIAAPYWFLILLFCIPPIFWAFGTWRLRRRRANARCINCGYDLRASVGRCPDCGAPILPSADPRPDDATPEPVSTIGPNISPELQSEREC